MNLKATFSDRGSTSHRDPTSSPKRFACSTKQKASPPCLNLCNKFCTLRRDSAPLTIVLCLPSSALLIKQRSVCISLTQRRVHHYFRKDVGGSKGWGRNNRVGKIFKVMEIQFQFLKQHGIKLLI